jgi:hypothetical protein
MSAKRERRDDGKKLRGSKTLSLWPVNTHHEVITLDEILGFLQSEPEFTCVLPAKSLRIKLGHSHLGFACSACDARHPLLRLDFWEQGGMC